jgi:hypothetical protein
LMMETENPILSDRRTRELLQMTGAVAVGRAERVPINIAFVTVRCQLLELHNGLRERKRLIVMVYECVKEEVVAGRWQHGRVRRG